MKKASIFFVFYFVLESYCKFERCDVFHNFVGEDLESIIYDSTSNYEGHRIRKVKSGCKSLEEIFRPP
jgi:hypothetical protein